VGKWGGIVEAPRSSDGRCETEIHFSSPLTGDLCTVTRKLPVGDGGERKLNLYK